MNACLHLDGTQDYPLHGAVSIGRQPENIICLDSPKVSRRHALIHPQDGQDYWLVDLGSSNGTFLNGKRLQQPSQLNSGDVIGIGDSQILFQKEDSESTHAAAGVEYDRTLCEVMNKNCWLLLLDIIGFTELSQSTNPDELSNMMGKWMLSCSGLIESHGGSVNKYLGDGVLAFWTDGPDQVGKIQGLLNEFVVYKNESPLPFRVVFHYGKVIFGGRLATGEESILGPELNLIFRIEKVSSSLRREMICTESFREMAGINDRTEDMGEHILKGFSKPCRVYALLG